MERTVINREDFISEIETYLSHISIANDYLVAYMTIANSTNSKEYNSKVNYAPMFFTMCFYSLFDALQLELSKLYCDSNKNEKTLYKLINKVEGNSKIFSSNSITVSLFNDKTENLDIQGYLKLVRKSLDDLKSIISNLNTRRDKKIAHNDKKYFFSQRDIYINSPLTMNDFRALINFAGDFCNNLLVFLNTEPKQYNRLWAEDLKNLLNKCN